MTAEEIIELIWKKHTSLIAEAFVELQNDIGRNC